MNHDEPTRILETNQPTVDQKKNMSASISTFSIFLQFLQSFPFNIFNQATTNIKLGIQLPINENAGSLPSAMGLPSHAAVNSVSLSQRKNSQKIGQSLIRSCLKVIFCDFTVILCDPSLLPLGTPDPGVQEILTPPVRKPQAFWQLSYQLLVQMVQHCLSRILCMDLIGFAWKLS